MKISIPQLNLLAAWAGMLLGFVSGLGLGLKFHDDNWLGGYTSLKRRLYRLAHISFFGLGAVNLFFYFTAQRFSPADALVILAAWSFVVGAVSMPVCCILMAKNKALRVLFAIPVVSLITGGTLTLWKVVTL